MDITVSIALITAGSTLGAVLIVQLFQLVFHRRNQMVSAKVEYRKEYNKSRELAFKNVISAIEGYQIDVQNYIDVTKQYVIDEENLNVNGVIYKSILDFFHHMVGSRTELIRNSIKDSLLYTDEDLTLQLNIVLMCSVNLFNICVSVNANDYTITDDLNKLLDQQVDIYIDSVSIALTLMTVNNKKF